MADQPPFQKKRAPTLYAIITIKVVKGVLLLLLAMGVYQLADNDLPEAFRELLQFLHLDPEKEFFVNLAAKIGAISEVNLVRLSVGAAIYSLFSLVEGLGLMFRVSWAGWMAIGESAFFIPIEVYDLMHRFKIAVLIILILNVIIVWYLYQNRHWLFRHHHHR